MSNFAYIFRRHTVCRPSASCSLFHKKVEVSYALIKMTTKHLQKGGKILEFTYLEILYT
jgi:hypothetical protein